MLWQSAHVHIVAQAPKGDAQAAGAMRQFKEAILNHARRRIVAELIVAIARLVGSVDAHRLAALVEEGIPRPLVDQSLRSTGFVQ